MIYTAETDIYYKDLQKKRQNASFSCIHRMRFLFSVFCVNVNACNSTLEDSHCGSVTTCFYNAGFFLNAYYLSDNTADSSYLVTDLKIVSHCVGLFFLLFLGSYHKEIKSTEHESDHSKGYDTAEGIGCGC